VPPDLAKLSFVPLTAAHAAELKGWRYPPPYDCYDLTDADPAELADPGSGFYAVLAGTGLAGTGLAGMGLAADGLIAYRSFGADGRVPGWEYDDAALDTGGGLRPDLTGRGLGRTVIAAGLAFGQHQFAPHAFRVTVASFNLRAGRVVASLGFRPVGRFPATADGRPYDVLVRQMPACTPPGVDRPG
jgi:ribosomal-protein-alanine N-acetyltransferase